MASLNFYWPCPRFIAASGEADATFAILQSSWRHTLICKTNDLGEEFKPLFWGLFMRLQLLLRCNDLPLLYQSVSNSPQSRYSQEFL